VRLVQRFFGVIFCCWAGCAHSAEPDKDAKPNALMALITPKPDPVPRCVIKRRLHVDVDHDGKLDTLLWTRCVPPDEKKDDHTASYPQDTFVVTTEKASFPIYDNLSRAHEEQLSDVSILPLSATDERVLLKVGAYGDRHVQLWQLVDIADGAPRRWLSPSLNEAFARLLQAHESLSKDDGPTLTVGSDCIEVARPVFREGDETCCPSGGQVKACLAPGKEGLQVAKSWREQPEGR
jgi:hypothetical protein